MHVFAPDKYWDGGWASPTVCKGTKATQTTIAIVETFARIKNLTRNIKEISEVKNEKSKQNLMQRSGEIISEILGDDLSLSETETSFELNFAVLKLNLKNS